MGNIYAETFESLHLTNIVLKTTGQKKMCCLKSIRRVENLSENMSLGYNIILGIRS